MPTTSFPLEAGAGQPSPLLGVLACPKALLSPKCSVKSGPSSLPACLRPPHGLAPHPSGSSGPCLLPDGTLRSTGPRGPHGGAQVQGLTSGSPLASAGLSPGVLVPRGARACPTAADDCQARTPTPLHGRHPWSLWPGCGTSSEVQFLSDLGLGLLVCKRAALSTAPAAAV